MSRIMKLASKDVESPEKRQEYTVCVVGCGRNGLITASLFIEAGFNVIGVDSNRHTVHQLKRGKSPFTETKFRKFTEKQLKNSRFRATTNLRKATPDSDVIIICFPPSLDKKKKGGIGLHCTGVSKRRFVPNLQKIRIKEKGAVKRVLVCTSCIQKGNIEKP